MNAGILKMCLLLIAKQKHPQYKLVVAANRDEFYGRSTAPASWWDDYPLRPWASTMLLVDRNNQVTFMEKGFVPPVKTSSSFR